MTDFKPAILEALETMRLGQLATKEKGASFKALAYKKAMDELRRHDGPVTRVEDVKDLPGFGKKIIDKVHEIITTGALRAAERVKTETDVGALETLMGIHGIGPAKARTLIAAGIKTIAELRAAASTNKKLLTAAQTMGLKFYEDGIQRIPRAEMVQHEERLVRFVLPPQMPGTIVGSYRRGAANSGDIDLLVTYNESYGEASAIGFLAAIIESLTVSGYIIGTLVSGPKKWMGYVRLASDLPARRLDILLTPPAEFPYAVLYFTGSDKFNIAFRRHCLTLGYTLNEHTLTPTREGVAPVPIMTKEEDIFAFVGLKYVPPTERVDGKQIKKL